MMRITVRTFILLLGLLVPIEAALSAAAQQPDERLQKRLAEVKDRLKLTDDQVERIRPVFASEARKMRDLRDRYESSGQSRRAKRSMAKDLRAIRSETDGQLKPILTKTQMDELKTLREEWRDQLRARVGETR